MRVTLHSDAVDLAPGASAEVRVTVVNDGRTPVEPTLAVRGLDDGVAEGTLELGALAPGATTTTTVRLTLPGDAPAGARRVAVEARDGRGRAPSVSVPLRVRTQSAAGVSMHLSPRELRGRLRHRVRVQLHNHGSEAIELAVRGGGDGLRLRIRPAQVTLLAGGSVRLDGRLRARRPAVFRTRRLPLVVTAQGATTPVSASASFQQATLMPASITRGVAVLLAFALWAAAAVVAVRTAGSPGAEAATPTTVATAAAPGAGQPGAAGAGGGAGAGAAAGEGGDDGAVVAAAAVVSGAVTGPEDPGGTQVVIERVALGDVSSDEAGGGNAGRIVAQTPVAPLEGAVLSRQSTVADEGGRFRFADGLEMPAVYRVTAIRPGYEVTSVIAALTEATPTAELVVALVPATGRLSGFLTGTDGRPLAGAAVTVTDGVITYTARTGTGGDAAGRWALDGVRTPSTYVVTAVADGYASGSLVVPLGGGEARLDVDLGLRRGLGTLRGLLSSRGTGVGGITLRLQAVDGDLVRTTTSLTQGSLVGTYGVPSLPFGRYTVTLSGEGWQTQSRQVVVDAGDVVLDVDDLRRSTATIQGRVVQMAADRCEYPAPGSNGRDGIRPQPCGNVGVTVANPAGTWRTTTATGTGEFRVSGVPSGTFTVTFERYGYAPATLGVTVQAGDVVTVGPAAPDGSVQPVVLALVSTGDAADSSARGTVRDDTDPTRELRIECLNPIVSVVEGSGLSARVVFEAVGAPRTCPFAVPPPSGTGRLLPAGSIDACPAGTSGAASGPRACFIEGGGLRIDGLTPGAKLVRISADGFDETSIVVQVPASGVAELGVIRLLPLGTLSGVVTGPGDAPVAGGRVFVTPASPATQLPTPPVAADGGWYGCEVDVDGNGTAERGYCVDASPTGEYRFGRALRSGEYRVVAPVGAVTSVPARPAPPAASLDHETRERRVRAQAGQSITTDLGLRRFGAITGAVQAPADDGSGFVFIDDATITVTANNVPAGTVQPRVSAGSTSGLAPGRYRIDRLLTVDPQAGYTVRVSRTGYSDSAFQVPGGVAFNAEVLRNVMLLRPAAPVTGRVVWRDDPGDPTTARPIAGATVLVTGVTGFDLIDTPPFREPVVRSYTALTRADGTFDGGPDAPVFVAGRPTVRVVAPGFTTTVDEVELGGVRPQSVNVTTVMEPLPRTLNGTVRLNPAIATGELVDEATLRAGLTVTVQPRSGGQAVTTQVAADGTFAVPSLRPDLRADAFGVTVRGKDVDTTQVTAALAAAPTDAAVELPNLGVERSAAVRVVVRSSVASGDRPEPGLTVELRQGATVLRSAVTCVDPSAPGGVASCPAGSVRFDDLAPGTYTARVSGTGWVPAEASVDLVGQRTRTVTVTDVRRYGTITGEVTGRISPGDPSSAPVNQALVTATATIGGQTLTRTARSGADGSFTITGDLPAGTWTVSASMPGFQAMAAGERGTVEVADEEARAIDRTLVLTALPASLTGVVTDAASGSPLPGVTVQVVETASSVVTGSDGRYTFASLPPRAYTVEFGATDGRSSVTRQVVLRAGESGTLNLVMPGPVGTVFGYAETRDLDTNAAARLAGVTVELLGPAGAGAGGTSTTGGGTTTTDAGGLVLLGTRTTDEGGNFTFDSVPVLPAGQSYQLRFSRSTYDTVSRTVAVVARATTFVTATMPLAQQSVTVRVRSSAGATPLTGVTVTATRTGAGGITRSGVTAGVNGEVALQLPPGAWQVAATGGAGAQAGGGTDPHADGTLSGILQVDAMPAPAPGTQTITLDRFEGIRITAQGRDHAQATAAVLTGATVTASRGGTTLPLGSVAGVPGTYEVRAAMSAGTWTITAVANGYTTTSGSVTVTADAVATGTLTLDATPRTVTVSASSSAGGALAGVVLSATLDGTSPPITAGGTTNGSGTASLTLAPGTWTVSSTNGPSLGTPHGDGTVTSVVVPVAPGATPTPAVVLDRYESITLTVTGTAHASAGTVGAPTGLTVTASRDGSTLTFTEVGGGVYRLRAPLASGGSPSTWAVAVTDAVSPRRWDDPGAAVDVAVSADADATGSASVAAAARTVTVTVRSNVAAGLLNGSVVTATLAGNPDVTATTGAAGTAQLALRPGQWQVTATGAGVTVGSGTTVDPHGDLAATSLTVPPPGTAVPTPQVVLDRTEGVDVTVRVQMNEAATAVAATAATVTVTQGGTSRPLAHQGDGRYLLREPLASGAWTLEATVPGYEPHTEPVTVAPDTVTTPSTVTLLASPRPVQVRVVSSAGGAGVDGVTVRATATGVPTVQGTTSSSGGTAGSVTLTLRPAAWTLATTDATSRPTPYVDGSTTVTVPVGPAAAPSATITVTPAERIEVQVRMQGATSVTVDGATVRVRPDGSSGAWSTLAATGVPGQYRLVGSLAVGGYDIEVTGPSGYGTATGSVSVPGAGGTGSATVDVASTASLTGRVRSAFSGGGTTDLQGATVTVSGGGQTFTAASQADGTFAVPVPPSRTGWSVLASATGHQPGTPVTATSTTGAVAVGDLVLQRSPVTVSGVVTSGGTPLDGVSVRVERLAGGGAQTVLSGAGGTAGTYEVGGLDPDGTFRVTFTAAGVAPLTRTVAPNGAAVTLDFTVPGAADVGDLAVTVEGLLEDGTAVALPAGTTVRVTGTVDGNGVDETRTLGAGTSVTATFTGLPATDVTPAGDDYTVTITLPGWGQAGGSGTPLAPFTAAVSDAAPTAVSRTLVPARRDLTLTLTGATGTAVDGQAVALLGGQLPGAGSPATVTGGTVTFTGLAVAADYRLRLTRTGVETTSGAFAVGVGTGAATQSLQLNGIRADVTVQAPGNQSPADVAVTATRSGGSAVPLVDQGSGVWRLEGFLATGTWTVDATTSETAQWTVTVDPATVTVPATGEVTTAVTFQR